MTHASLFSGIGGFDLAADWMGWENLFHCEWNPFGQQVLKHHFPKSISYNDITKTDFTIHRGQVDILSGGFPCQPYSTAGLRKGKEDERHLWPAMLRAIREIEPSWVVGENVRGLVSWGGGWYSTKCKLTWKLKGTKYSRFYFQLVPLTHPTEGTEFGLLPTPTKSDFNPRWKTKNWEGNSDLPSVMNAINGTRSQLNPLFVEEMMGFPMNWTMSVFQNGKKNL